MTSRGNSSEAHLPMSNSGCPPLPLRKVGGTFVCDSEDYWYKPDHYVQVLLVGLNDRMKADEDGRAGGGRTPSCVGRAYGKR